MNSFVSVQEQFNSIFEKKPVITAEIRAAYNPIVDSNAFLDGMMDADKGIDEKTGRHCDYGRGYHAQKQLEAIQEYR